MSNAKQSEILFLWDAKMCNPNGDMATDNAPRFDDVDEKAIVSDVRVKRTIRDDLQYRKTGNMIYVNNEEILKGQLKAEARFTQLKSNNSGEDKDVFLSCIDNRLFGGVAPNSNIQLTGAVQFNWSKSLNRTETVLKQGVGAFVTKGDKKTFRVDNYIPYGIFAMYGSVNRMHAAKTQASEDDVVEMLDSLWYGTKFLNTRSKEGQKPRLLMRVIYKEESKYFIGLLDELISLKNEDSLMIRNIEEAELDFSKLKTALKKAESQIESVEVVLDDALESYKEEIKGFLEEDKIKILGELELSSVKS